jgi:hypothetical protein
MAFSEENKQRIIAMIQEQVPQGDRCRDCPYSRDHWPALEPFYLGGSDPSCDLFQEICENGIKVCGINE